MSSKRTIWIGRILSTLAVLFLVLEGVLKFFLDKLPPEVTEASAVLGWPVEKMPLVGSILLTCTLLYAIPRTAVLGAILLTGYLGGAIATQLRVGNPLFSHTLFPIYIAAIVWLGLYLRDTRARNILSAN